MRVTVEHDKTVDQVRQSIDRGFDRIFGGLPIASVDFVDQRRQWTGDRLDFSFTARSGFINVPLKGYVIVEPKQVIVELDLPPFVNQFIPEQKVKSAVESQVKGLLT